LQILSKAQIHTMAAEAPSRRQSSSSPLLLLLDGVLSQSEPTVNLALQQIQTIDPTLKDVCKSPLRSSAALELIVERLISIQPHLARVSSESDGSSPLHFAASIGNVHVASLLLQQYPASAVMHNKKGKIPLHYAAREGRIDMVHFLLHHVPVSASVMTHKLKLPIHFAAGDGHVEVVRALLKANPMGASTPSKKGKVALHFAARWGHLDIARDLYKIFPQCVNIQDLDGNVPLHDAAREGQLEMAKHLVRIYPEGMCKSNIRGELPLFGAIRSGNVELCDFLIRSWPESGKHVLQIVRPEDHVESWDPVILDLCLRGAVDNFSGCPRNENAAPIFAYAFPTTDNSKYGNGSPQKPRVLTSCDRGNSTSSEASMEVARIAVSAASLSSSPLYAACSPMNRLTPGLDITLPRYKSPILQDNDCAKKRSVAEKTHSIKKSRRENSVEISGAIGNDVTHRILASQTYLQLHAALECSAATTVLECLLDRHADQQLTQVDDHGKLPLHVALSHCRSKEMAELILTRVWEPYKEAAFCRDYLGRLPLHLALASRADSRLIEALLQENPSSGVDHCDAVDPRFGEKLPIDVATEYGCDLSTIFLLVKADPTAVKSRNFFNW
jgi:ankyrin repeat protein